MWTFVWSPVRFFEARRCRHVDWITALAAPALCAGLQGVSVSIFSGKTRPLLDTVLARLDLPYSGLPSGQLLVAMSALSYPMYFALLTLAVLALDVLGNDSGQPARLTELTALSFYTQVPYCLLMILIAWVWVPEPMRLPSARSTTELLTEVQRYRETMWSGPLLSTGRLVSSYSMLWLVAVISTALKVVAGLSTRATVVVAMVLLAVCAAGPIFSAAVRLLR